MKLIKEIIIGILCIPAVFSVLFLAAKLYFYIFPQCLSHADQGECSIIEGSVRICLSILMFIALICVVGGISELLDYCEMRLKKNETVLSGLNSD